MKLQDFLDLGFEITLNELWENWTRVPEYSKEYLDILKFAQEVDKEDNLHTYEKTKTYASKLKCSLGFLEHHGYKLVRLSLHYNKQSRRVIIEKNGVKLCLFVDKDDETVDSVDDYFSYFNSHCGVKNVYERYENDNETSLTILETINEFRKKNAQEVRNYYNKQLRDIKEIYKYTLDEAKVGLKWLKEVTSKNV